MATAAVQYLTIIKVRIIVHCNSSPKSRIKNGNPTDGLIAGNVKNLWGYNTEIIKKPKRRQDPVTLSLGAIYVYKFICLLAKFPVLVIAAVPEGTDAITTTLTKGGFKTACVIPKKTKKKAILLKLLKTPFILKLLKKAELLLKKPVALTPVAAAPLVKKPVALAPVIAAPLVKKPLAAGTLGAAGLGTAGLGAATIGAGTIGAGALKTGALKAGALGTAGLGTAGLLGAGTIGAGTLGAGTLGAATLGAGTLGAGTLGAATIGAGTLGAAALGAGAIGTAAVVGTGAVAGTYQTKT